MFSGSDRYNISRSISMTSKFKSMFKRQASMPVRTEIENTEESSAIMHEMKNVPVEFLRRQRNTNSTSSDVHETSASAVSIRRKSGPRRHNTSLGAIEDLLQCPICKDRLKSPRMMPCQHTFCQKCLEKQLDQSANNNAMAELTCPLCNLRVSDRAPDLLPTNLYIESLLYVMENPGEGLLRLASPKPTVRFASLPGHILDSETTNTSPRVPDSSRSPGLSSFCNKCSAACSRDNRCKHCKQVFCDLCWIAHVEQLKEKLEKIVPQIEETCVRFSYRMDEFRAKVDEFKDSIEKDIESRIAELMQEREERIKRLAFQAERAEEAARDVQQRISKVAEEAREQMNGSYDALTDKNAKVKVFLTLHREATELMNVEGSWNPELGDVHAVNSTKLTHVDLLSGRGDVEIFYRRKVFSPKLIVTRELVQRPSGMAHDPWRDHVFIACPGARQIVVLDRKYKLYKRYQNTEMMAPQGLAYVESTEELYVTDKWKHCIFVFNRKGEILRHMCKKGQGESQLSCPEGLAVHARCNLLYVADTGNDRIQILELDGTCRGFIGPTGKPASSVTKTGKVVGIVVNHLNQPTDVSVTDDFVIVADCGNHKVKIFNHDGVLIHTIGGSGTLRRQFRSPEVVQVDSKGNIIVGDSGNGRVQIFSPQGELLRIVGGKASKSNKFGWVSGLLVKNNFDLMVGDNKNNAVKVF